MRTLTGAAGIALGLATLAVGVASSSGGGDQARFSARVDAVHVPVTVTDRGRPVMGLTAADFELRDEGVAQKVEILDRGNVALDVILALDASASVGRGLEEALRHAARAAIAELRPSDRATIVHFSHQVTLPSPLTSDLRDVEATIYREPPGGATALFDALVAALVAASPSPARRTLLILYTDGLDTISWHLPADVIAAARRSEMVIYAVVPKGSPQLREPVRLGEQQTMSAFLAGLTTQTGGELLVAESSSLSTRFREIVQRFAQGYQLLFYPQGVERHGWHALSVRLRRGRTGAVQARRGYHAD